MSDQLHARQIFQDLKGFTEALREKVPGHPLLEYAPTLRGENSWTDELWEKYHQEFNPSRRLSMPEVDLVYVEAVEAALSGRATQEPRKQKRA